MNEIYRSAKNLSIFAIVGLGLIALLQVIAVIVGIGQLASPEMTIDLDEPVETSLWLILQSFVALVQFPIYLATVVMFLVWLFRAHKNLQFLRPAALRFSPGWAVGWWFIPFANLVKPFQVVREVWWESDPEVEDDGPMFLSESLHSAPTYMGVWWAFWLLSNFLSNITSRVFDPDDMASVTISGYLFVLTGIATVIAAALAIHVVRDITARQEARASAIGETVGNEPPPPPMFGQPVNAYSREPAE